MKTIDCTKDSAESLFESLRQKLSPRGDVVSEAGRQRTIALFGEPLTPQQVVERICGDVRRGGLPVVLDYTAKLDRKELTRETLRVSPAEFDAAFAAADQEFLKTLGRIRDNVVEFQSKLLNQTITLTRSVSEGARVELRQRYLPLKRVGICIPGGAAAYPSTLLMTAVPAQVAGVKEIAVVAPPTESRSSAPATCSSRWPRSSCSAKSTSTASPAPAKSSCWPMQPHKPISSPAI
ncbi:MAG: histidinol dehydrogenase [Planctomycetota bacterium]|nr:MAG: histidinol dehydrogenase [Planctomycetota bacterium]